MRLRLTGPAALSRLLARSAAELPERVGACLRGESAGDSVPVTLLAANLLSFISVVSWTSKLVTDAGESFESGFCCWRAAWAPGYQGFRMRLYKGGLQPHDRNKCKMLTSACCFAGRIALFLGVVILYFLRSTNNLELGLLTFYSHTLHTGLHYFCPFYAPSLLGAGNCKGACMCVC